MKLSNTISRSMEQETPSPFHYLALRSLIIMLSPLAPHISSELWTTLTSSSLGKMSCSWAGGEGEGEEGTPTLVFDANWPKIDNLLLKCEESQQISIVLSLNGKKNCVVSVPKSVGEDPQALEALALEKTGKNREEVLRFIIPPGKGMVNLVLNKNKK
uniref:leucine--tRNA ligase n=1 Tax=Paramoeba aestuarina TaxID=180227 RepID=A0A7S4PJ38_9EUKA|mmetsp:Transcript_6998/g.10610  ORF Transcript_6998/g.10610 Transcript_6998/m.10610 type:complete len:158 (+) Transcript_6998:2-475(+)